MRWTCLTVYDAEADALAHEPADDSDHEVDGCRIYAWTQLRPTAR